jgi:hypothetical protein
MHNSATSKFSVITSGAAPEGSSEMKPPPQQLAMPDDAALPPATPDTAVAGASELHPSKDIDATAAALTKAQGELKVLKKLGSRGEAMELVQLKIDELRMKLAVLKKSIEAEGGGSGSTFNRKNFEDTILRKMFVIPSFEIHGGVKGLFDLG